MDDRLPLAFQGVHVMSWAPIIEMSISSLEPVLPSGSSCVVENEWRLLSHNLDPAAPADTLSSFKRFLRLAKDLVEAK